MAANDTGIKRVGCDGEGVCVSVGVRVHRPAVKTLCMISPDPEAMDPWVIDTNTSGLALLFLQVRGSTSECVRWPSGLFRGAGEEAWHLGSEGVLGVATSCTDCPVARGWHSMPWSGLWEAVSDAVPLEQPPEAPHPLTFSPDKRAGLPRVVESGTAES